MVIGPEPAGPSQGRIPERAARRYPYPPAGPPQGRIPERAAQKASIWTRPSAKPTDPAILAEQVAYYRKRAGEYDEWWFRTGRYDHGAELNAAWVADVAEVETALTSYLGEVRPRRALELACGTGLFTR